MKTEVEAKFLAIDHEEMRQKLREAGAICEQPMRLMRRVTIENPLLISKQAYVRIRDEGYRVTLTYKQFDSLSVDGAKEIETTVGSFEDTVSLFTEIGMAPQSFQESKRETWRLDDVEIVLDEWPWLKPYIELEGNSEQELKNVALRLGLKWEDAVFGDVMVAYRAQYPHLTVNDTVGRVERVAFGDPLPNLLRAN